MTIWIPSLPIGITKGGSNGDVDALAWAAAVTAAGGSYSSNTLAAVSAFCVSAKNASYWSKLNRINLFCGDQLTAALVPLKVGGGFATETNVNFVAGDYTEATGLTGNGTTKYLNTGLNPSVSLTLNNTHVMQYVRGGSQNLLFGASEATNRLLSGPNALTITDDQYTSTAGTGRVSGSVTAPYASLIGSRESAVAHTIYQRGLSVGTNAGSAGALPNLNMFLFAWNNAGAPSWSFSAGTGPYAGYSIGSGLTAAEAAAFDTHLQAFNTALGRQVNDPDATAWASAVTANGGTYSASTLSAVSIFCDSAKKSGYWSKLNRINLFCGNDLAAALVPLKVGGGSATETNVNFVPGDYSEATGLTGNGTTKYLNTGLNPSVSLTLNDTHGMLYLRGGSQDFLSGASEATNRILFGPNGTTFIDDQYASAGGGRLSGTVTAPYASLIGSRTGAAAHAIYQRGTSVNSNATVSGALPNLSLFLFAWNNAGAPSWSISTGTGACAGYSFGSGLSAGDAAAFALHLQNFQAALGRHV